MHVTIPKGDMGYDQYTVPDTVAVEPTLTPDNIRSWFRCIDVLFHLLSYLLREEY